ncbi:MAG TPA: tetratricopeptide repeat protein, partial [Candidatus Eremiobacteraeota bacterium]|nr:tetratricopeptide repeat protein [Candidatus Eremiobacteraeota bacterium]
MQCPNCKQDYGEMITICPVCFIEITQSAQASTIRERRSKRKREDTSSKSKGLLESTLASWFGKSDTESPASVKTERKKRQDFSKSSSGDYSSFDISSGVMETPSVSSFSEGISSVQSISSGPISILTTDSQYTDKAESNESLETVIKSSYTPSAPPPKYETPEPSYSQTPSPSRDQLAQEHYRKGSEYEKQGRLKEALMEYGQAIAFNPKWSEPYFKCAMILIKNKDYNNALQRLLEVIKLNPNHA